MHNKAQVRFVESHAQRGRGYERFEFVVDQGALEAFAFLRLGAAGVSGDVPTGVFECLGEVVRSGDRQAVDDAGAVDIGEILRDPRRALRWVR